MLHISWIIEHVLLLLVFEWVLVLVYFVSLTLHLHYSWKKALEFSPVKHLSDMVSPKHCEIILSVVFWIVKCYIHFFGPVHRPLERFKYHNIAYICILPRNDGLSLAYCKSWCIYATHQLHNRDVHFYSKWCVAHSIIYMCYVVSRVVLWCIWRLLRLYIYEESVRDGQPENIQQLRARSSCTVIL